MHQRLELTEVQFQINCSAVGLEQEHNFGKVVTLGHLGPVILTHGCARLLPATAKSARRAKLSVKELQQNGAQQAA